MAINKTLFKALRAGGLGHRAAELLSDRNGRYGIGKVDSYDTSDDLAYISIQQANFTVASAWPPTTQKTAYIETAPVVALAAGGSIVITHLLTIDGEDVKPPGMFYVGTSKVADANGIPIAPVVADTVGVDRSESGTLSLPGVTGGFTYTNFGSGSGVRLTQATAGWYAIDAQFARSDIQYGH